MLEGSGEATAAVSPAAAFAFLADPRHADEWFAGAGFETPPQGPARAGLEWSFARTAGTRRVQPLRMAAYEPPSRFTWETTIRSPLATNFVFEMRCEPTEIASAPEPLAPEAGEAASLPDGAHAYATSIQGTRLCFTIRLRPGVVQWASIAAGFVLVRRALRERAQRTVDRAADAVETVAPAARGGDHAARKRGTSTRRGRKRR